MIQRPVAQALILCEKLVVEDQTRNVSLINCFTQRKVTRVPSRLPFIVVAFLTDGIGKVPLRCEIHDLADLQEIYRHESELRFDNPLMSYRLQLPVHDFAFPHFGDYQVVLSSMGEIICTRSVRILRKEQS